MDECEHVQRIVVRYKHNEAWWRKEICLDRDCQAIIVQEPETLPLKLGTVKP